MYQVLYRKYRPKVFSDVYGQDHVTSTLINEIKENRISHAYLFTGSRGTGKTSCAKILAKAVNCEHNENGEPCNECEVCKGLDAGTIYDVVEIDAASNNGVDNIRDLREEANYTPSRGKYRVYIIDEVHMLSTGAFNALLKTLEEPPAHVIFILATTEVHKLPATILSRCQRFDFKRIQPETMAVRLRQVAGCENMQLDDDAAVLISRIADGGMRDALSILDQCAGRSKSIDSKLVSEVAGIAGREALYELSDAICHQNSGDALNIISRLHQNSYDMERLCVEMINHFRNFLIVKTVNKSRELIICTDDEYNTIVSSAENFTLAKIIFALDLFQNTLTVIKGGANSRIEMEMSFIKLCQPKLEASTDALLDRISALENAFKNGISVSVAKPVKTVVKEEQSEKQQAARNDIPVPIQEKSVDIEKPAEELPPVHQEPTKESEQPMPAPVQRTEATSAAQTEFTQWADFMEAIYKSDIALYGVLNGARGYIRDEFFLIDSQNPVLRQFIKIPTHSKAIKQALFEVTGQQFKLGLFKKKEDDLPKRDPLEDLISMAQGHIDMKIE
ncbi:MAG: DNA polymerase III subunit gamma/tau [Eubacterium sp.]|nr:DNA polymerase III subunit gamma/tau [Eubacterium sp.]